MALDRGMQAAQAEGGGGETTTGGRSRTLQALAWPRSSATPSNQRTWAGILSDVVGEGCISLI